jgi:hypothetical protein
MDDKPWLVTWTTYGSWLPGDPRGFRTFRAKEYVPPPARYARDGEPTYDPSDYADRYAKAKEQVPHAVTLTREEQNAALQAIVDELTCLHIPTDIVAVNTDHVHLIARFGSHSIRPTVGRLKSGATRAIPNPGDRKRIWTKNCHMESLNSDEDLHNAVAYVRCHREQGAIIWEPQAAALGGG